MLEFLFVLCRTLGFKHPDYIDLTVQQIAEWKWMYENYSWGDSRADDRTFAALAALGGSNLDSTRWPYFPFEQLASSEELLEKYKRITEIIDGQRQNNDSASSARGGNEGSPGGL